MAANQKVIGDYSAAGSIDGTTHQLLIQPGNSSTAYNKINRNVLLGVTGQPMDVSTSQGVMNKNLDNTNTITAKDTLFTLQDDADTTKQAKFQLSGLTTATTRTYTLPDASSSLVDTTSTQTLSNKTLTSPTINGGTVSNSSISSTSIAGFTVPGNGTVYGLSVNSGVIQTANAVPANALASNSVTPNKLATGAATASVVTAETTSSTTYVDLATVTDSVTVNIGINGLALVVVTGNVVNNTSGNVGFISFAASGSNTIAAADGRAFFEGSLSGLTQGQGSWSYMATGLTTGSTTFKLKYRTSANSCTFQNRFISVIPL